MMTTNVRSANLIQGIWKDIVAEANLYTAQPATYSVLWFPDMENNIVLEESRIEDEEKISQLFMEFAEEDMKLAEIGMPDYNELLIAEDREC